jgi:hypothetical protein
MQKEQRGDLGISGENWLASGSRSKPTTQEDFGNIFKHVVNF